MKTLDLNGRWEFKAIDAYDLLPADKRNVTQWMTGTVPGTVHTDLLANKKIPDPFYRMQENDVQWIDSQQWLYRREFLIPRGFLDENAIDLVAQGLDTYAHILCNGETVAHSENMFVEHRWDVRKYLRTGTNTIEILFDSPTIRAKAIEKKYGALSVALEPHRAYVRKAQYSFGWDWGPKLTTSGIWRGISLETYSHARMHDPFVKVRSVNKREAVVEFSMDVERGTTRPLTLRTSLRGAGWFTEHTALIRGVHVEFTARIPEPQLWWPNGCGEQPLYSASFSLICDEIEIHRLEVPFAIRTIRLLQEKDDEGKSFIFEINGMKIFCKGADWIPGDNFIPRIADATYDRLLRMAKDAHMNMIRVWGGGIYEQDIFYELCDRLGLMVWQDFMFACGEYPEEHWFLAGVREEAEKVVKRLRNHPSIVVWCGNNECEYLFCMENPDKNADDMRGMKIFRDVLPVICQACDGSRPYWRSSPFGDGDPNAESNGNHHQWRVWSNWGDFKEYEKSFARFITEFGFQSPPNRRTMEEVTVPADRQPQSKVMEHHNKQVEGTERLFRFQSAHYRVSDSFDGFIYTCQLVQAEALKCAAEHWRRRKFKTAGVLFWQLNDCWPVSSWSVVDSALRPKASYYFAKKFYAPLLVSFQNTGNGIAVWVTNDLTTRVSGKLVTSLRSFRGRTIWTKRQDVNMAPGLSNEIYHVEQSAFSDCERTSHYLHTQLWIEGVLASENRFLFEEPKHLQLPKPRITKKLRMNRNNAYTLRIHSNTFAKNLRLEMEGEDVVFDDNYFDVDAGGWKDIKFQTILTLSQVKKKIRLRWL